ncbi:MAG: hypothetical protein FJ267_10055 [Planctomycetes bacterium]|nr:hypothetical protein [Planctomycetota bacterium]
MYVGVLATTTIVALIGLSSLSVAHLGLKSAARSRDAGTAQILARSAVEEGVRVLTTTPSWRSSFVNNTTYPTPLISLNGGTISWKFVDTDGSLSDDPADAVRVYGIGKCGSATYVESVELYPTETPLTCLEAPFHCGSNVTLQFGANFTTSQFISTNGSLTATIVPSSVQGNVEAVGAITGTVTGTKKTPIIPRQMPSDTVFDYYLANGTWIDISAIPKSIGTATIQKQVLSPTLNPFGPAGNSEGIYVIDCQNQDLKVCNSRILGTLVLINPGSTCMISSTMLMTSVSYNFPALLVRGNCQIQLVNVNLDEATLSCNFNPVGAPYGGVEDTDTTDSFPSKIKGLVYVSGQLNFPFSVTRCDFEGSVICGSVYGGADAKFSYRPTHLHYPPPGFSRGNTVVVMPGTWNRAALP